MMTADPFEPNPNLSVAELNKLIYRSIVAKEYESAYRYADQKMNKVTEDLLNMADEDLALLAYTEAMTGEWRLVKDTLQVLYENGDVQVDEEHLDLYGLVAAALWHLRRKHGRRAKVLLLLAAKCEPTKNHLGADEAVLQQVAELLEAK